MGGGEIWGAECGPNTYRFDFGTGVFDKISNPFSAIPSLTVGPNDVWAIDTSSTLAYQYDDFLGFENIACCSIGFQMIQAGGDGVWALSGNNIYRLVHIASSFVQVPGSLVSISVGSGGGVWGINSSHQVFVFSRP